MSKRILPKACAGGMLYLAMLPLFLLPGAALVPGRLWIAALLPLPALLLTGGAGLLPGKRRTPALLLGILLMAAVCAALFLFTEPPGLLLFLPCLLMMLLFMPAMARPAHREWTVQQLGFGIILHIAAQFLKGFAMFEAAAAPVSWVFVAYLLAFLFAANRMVVAETGAASAKSLLTQNRKLLAVLCVLALALSNLKAIGTAVRAAITWIITAVMTAFVWLSSLLQPTGEGGESAPAGNPFAGLEETSEPSLFARIMEVVLLIVAALAAAALLFFAGRYLIRLLRKVFRKLMDKMRQYRQRISADYDDQSESLLDWSELRQTAADSIGRLRRRYLPVSWEKLSPAERVRRVYALLLRRADAPDPSRTAREMLTSGHLPLPNDAAPAAASLYERARYSSHPISAQEAEALRRQAGV